MTHQYMTRDRATKQHKILPEVFEAIALLQHIHEEVYHKVDSHLHCMTASHCNKCPYFMAVLSKVLTDINDTSVIRMDRRPGHPPASTL